MDSLIRLDLVIGHRPSACGSMRDIASGSVLVVIAFVYFFGARGLPSGPFFFPYVLSTGLFSLAVVIIVRGFRERQSFDGAACRSAGLIVLTILYAFVFVPVGFVVSTACYTAGVVLVLGQRGWLALIIPVATTAFIYGAFVVALGVALP